MVFKFWKFMFFFSANPFFYHFLLPHPSLFSLLYPIYILKNIDITSLDKKLFNFLSSF
jgi:hypothetical protein